MPYVFTSKLCFVVFAVKSKGSKNKAENKTAAGTDLLLAPFLSSLKPYKFHSFTLKHSNSVEYL